MNMDISWLVPALLAPAIYAVVTFIDKYIVSKEVKDYRVMPIYGAITGFFFGTVFWIVTDFPLLSYRDAFIVVTTGILAICSAALYFKAMSFEDASKLIILFQMIPILTLILAFLFLGEKISLAQLAGFVLIILAAIVVYLEKGEGKFYLSSAFFLILCVDLMSAISAVLIKFAIDTNSFSKVLSYESWGFGLGGAALYLLSPNIQSAFNESIRTIRRKALGVMFLNEGIFTVSKLLKFFAYSIGSAALVSVVGSTQVFFGILFGLMLTIVAPKIINENIGREELTKKILATLILFVGIWLVYKP